MNTILEIGKKYKQKELAEAMNISSNTFSKKRSHYLKHLEEYYDIEIKKEGRCYIYTILNQKKEYEKPKRINAKDMEGAANYAKNLIDKESIQTKKNIARKAFAEYNPKFLTENTLYTSYYSPGMNEWYGKEPGQFGTQGAFIERLWVRIDKITNTCYELSNEIMEEYFSYVEDYREFAKDIITVIKDCEEDYEENEEKLNGELKKISTELVKTANSRFYAKYGFVPVRANRYENGIIFNN